MAPLPHLAGLPDHMPTVATPGFRKTLHVVGRAVTDGDIVAITGDAGLGKTFAVAEATGRAPLPTVRLQVGPTPTPKEVSTGLLEALTGMPEQGEGWRVTNSLVAQLVEDPHVVVIDEAQNLDKKGLAHVRFIHDRGANAFPMLLVGGRSCADRLQSDPQLADRIGGWVEFRRIPKASLHKVLADYHPLLANTTAEVIHALDDGFAEGVFRRWARLLKEGLVLAPRSEDPDRINRKVADALLSTVVPPAGVGR